MMRTGRLKRAAGLFTIALLLGSTVLASASAPPIVEITIPSHAETTIAAGRDFYVQGTFSGFTITDDSSVTVILENEQGDTVRTVRNDIHNNTNMYVDFEQLRYYDGSDPQREKLKTAGMPDLIYDPALGVEQSFHHASIKCYFDQNGFSALIAGGETDAGVDNGMDWVDESGASYAPLAQGSYTVHVTVSDAQGPVATTEKTIVIGVTDNKLLTRFSPAAHLDAAMGFAQANGLRTYLDPFPGYWSKGDLFCEILPQWRAADATEYLGGNVHFLIYNVKASSSSYSVELGALQQAGRIEAYLTNYYYTSGEPVLNGIQSEIKAFAPGERLALTRAEIVSAPGEDGIYEQDDPAVRSYLLQPEDGISASAGDTIALYGVAAPFQLEQKDIVSSGNNAYSLKNKTALIRYTITGDGIGETVEKRVSLNRRSGGWDNYSELEFRHLLSIDSAWAGKTLAVSLEGFDEYGAAVPGTRKSLLISVAKASESTSPVQQEPPATLGSTSATPENNPETGDPVIIWMMLPAAAGTVALCLRRKKTGAK